MKKVLSLTVMTMFLFSPLCLAAESNYKCHTAIRYVWNGKKTKVRTPQPTVTATQQDEVPWAGQLVAPQQHGETKWCRMKNAAK
jgi:hypothetical protein